MENEAGVLSPRYWEAGSLSPEVTGDDAAAAKERKKKDKKKKSKKDGDDKDREKRRSKKDADMEGNTDTTSEGRDKVKKKKRKSKKDSDRSSHNSRLKDSPGAIALKTDGNINSPVGVTENAGAFGSSHGDRQQVRKSSVTVPNLANLVDGYSDTREPSGADTGHVPAERRKSISDTMDELKRREREKREAILANYDKAVASHMATGGETVRATSFGRQSTQSRASNEDSDVRRSLGERFGRTGMSWLGSPKDAGSISIDGEKKLEAKISSMNRRGSGASGSTHGTQKTPPNRPSYFPGAHPGDDSKPRAKTENGPLSHLPSAETYDSTRRVNTEKQKVSLAYFPAAESYAQLDTDLITRGGRSSFASTEEDVKAKNRAEGPSYFRSSERYNDDNLTVDAPSPPNFGPQQVSFGEAPAVPAGAFFITDAGTVASRERGSLSHHPSCTNIPEHEFDDEELNDTVDPKQEEDMNPEQPIQTKATPLYCTRRFKQLAAALACAAITIGITIPLLNKGGSSDVSSPPTATPVVDQFRVKQVRDILSTVSDATTLVDTSTPQGAAFNWIATKDSQSPLSNTPSSVQVEALLQRYALVVLYFSTSGEEWLRADGWLDGLRDECTWEHVTCVNGKLSSINAGERNNFNGFIPSELKECTRLRSLVFYQNSITGISSEISQLDSLIELDLSANRIGGTIPSSIYQLTSLQRLLLEENEFTGTLSPMISGLTKLTELSLLTNSLTGTLSSELRPLTSLEYLDLSLNKLKGNTTTIIEGLRYLSILFMNDNSFSGILSPNIQEHSDLQVLSLARNFMSGTLPTELGKLTLLVNVFLDQAGFQGTIPTELVHLSDLQILYLDVNNFSGTVPSGLCALPALTDLRVNPEMGCTCSSCSAS